MRINFMGLLHNAAMQLQSRDGATAFALLELANNLRLVARGEASVEEWRQCYAGHDDAPFDIDKLLPVKEPTP